MKNLVYKRAKIVIIIVLATICITATTLLLFRNPDKENTTAMTAHFIEQSMRNDNGTLATYLKAAPSEQPDTVAGREALSESLGLWMQYAVAVGDQAKFDESVRIMSTYFLSPQKYIQWKLQPGGQSSVTTNALGDDLRIVDALMRASALWDKPLNAETTYLELAKEIGAVLKTSVQKHGYFVDFYDFQRKETPDTLSLVYVDLSALQGMRLQEIMSTADYDKYEHLLLQMPDDGIFYPQVFHVTTGEYTYAASVNLIDQLIVGIHLTETNRRPEQLMSFLKKEFQNKRKLMGRYNRKARTPDVAYESPGVYGLAILLALKCDDVPWAKQLYDRMIQFRGQDPDYPGGYVFDGNTHIFDNLFPLLAETELNKHP